MHDITRALEVKMVCSYSDVKETLPREIRKYTKLSVDDGVIDDHTLAPHRPGVDTKVRLQKDQQGREKEVP